MNERIEQAAQADLTVMQQYRDLRAPKPDDALIQNAREWLAMAGETAELIADATNADISSMAMREKCRRLARVVKSQLERADRSLKEAGQR